MRRPRATRPLATKIELRILLKASKGASPPQHSSSLVETTHQLVHVGIAMTRVVITEALTRNHRPTSPAAKETFHKILDATNSRPTANVDLLGRLPARRSTSNLQPSPTSGVNRTWCSSTLTKRTPPTSKSSSIKSKIASTK